MTRTSLELHNCSMARAVDMFGDQWMLLILRDAFYGHRTFSAFQASLGVAKTVLSNRLQRLVRAGVLEKIKPRKDVDRSQYRLTAAGRDLFPVVIALVQWGDRWVFGAGNEPIQILERDTGAVVQHVAVRTRAGDVLAPRDVMFAPGPGAAATTL